MIDVAFSYTLAPGRNEGTQIVKLVGPLTLTTLFTFQNEFRAMKPPVLIMDLSETPYMDSAGLGLVMNQFVSAERNGRKFLLTGLNGRIKALMELTKVNTVLKVYPSVEEAEDGAISAAGAVPRGHA
jgi:anti-anti-sigma factor